MTDITICTNLSCELRAGCFRYRATPHKVGQSWSFWAPIDGCCEKFIPLQETDRIRATSFADHLNQGQYVPGGGIII